MICNTNDNNNNNICNNNNNVEILGANIFRHIVVPYQLWLRRINF